MISTIHDKIDNYLAADLHGELSAAERNELHTHLVECADCRKLRQETKLINKVLEENLASQKADGAFEQRMLAGFRTGTPKKTGFIANPIVDLMRLRVPQVAAITVCLLFLLMLGRFLTFVGGDDLLMDHFASFDMSKVPESEGVGLPPPETRRNAKVQSEIADEKRSSPASAPNPVDTYRRDDITRLGVRSAPELVEKPSLMAGRAQAVPEPPAGAQAEVERTVVAGSDVPTAEEVGPNPIETPNPALANRKLIRNATVELEIAKFDDAIQKITVFASEERGYVATTSSEKQENGKLKGEIVIKVIPENLDRFLQKIRGLGELKNQSLGTEDITKNYFDTDSRLKNARMMESRLIDMLKKKSDDINDLLQVEKELGRVREEIEKMQGELKFWDSQVQFATVTISLAEKDLEEAAKYLLKERAQLSLYTPEVEKIYNDIKTLASPKVQITNAQLDRDNTGRVSARVSMLIAPEESDAVIAQAKAMGRVENFQVQTERVAQGGEGMSENATTKRDKVELNITISRDEQEQALQQTSLQIRTSVVDEKTKALRDLAEKQNGRVRSSSFSRDPDGRQFANVALRVPMKNYQALMQSLDSLGKVENVSVQRQDRPDRDVDLANAPADLSIHVYSQGNIVSRESGLFATLRRTIAQSASAIMWSLRMIGVAIAFLAPWAATLVAVIWIAKRIRRARSK
ncbi:MAG: hypothetical protein QOG48_487 [Verrucomicrobiota bacterium]|jgi:hypothetical protein